MWVCQCASFTVWLFQGCSESYCWLNFLYFAFHWDECVFIGSSIILLSCSWLLSYQSRLHVDVRAERFINIWYENICCLRFWISSYDDMAWVLYFPGFKGCIAVKLCHFLNSRDCSSSNTCLYWLHHYIQITDHYWSIILISKWPKIL